MSYSEYGAPLTRFYDVEWQTCIRCRGDGHRVECYDDLCHSQDECMHDPANNICNLCAGTGYISEELESRWLAREWGEAVRAPDPDLWNQGKLHQVARERRSGGVEP